MNPAPPILHSLFLVLAVATVCGAVAGVRWRLRRLAARPTQWRSGIDPVVNACVRGGATILLGLVLGWAAAVGQTPRPDSNSCLSGDPSVAHSCEIYVSENAKVQR